MSLRSDKWIMDMVKNHNMIQNFIPHQVKINHKGEKCLSYGLSSFGYDVRCSDTFSIFTNVTPDEVGVIDPKNMKVTRNFIQHKGEYCIIPAHSFVLTSTIEYFIMPRHVTGLCIGKSTYARCGLILNMTPIEAGWEGNITLEISNTSPLPVKVYSNEGITQILFFSSDEDCSVSYSDRGGKYQYQSDITHAKV